MSYVVLSNGVGDWWSTLTDVVTNATNSGKGTPEGDAVAAATAAALQAAQQGAKAAWDAATSGSGSGVTPSDGVPVGLTDADAAVVFNDLVTKYHVPPAIAGNIVAKAKSLLQAGNSPDDVFNNYILPTIQPYQVKPQAPAPRAPKQFTTPGYVNRPGGVQSSKWPSPVIIALGVATAISGVLFLRSRKSK